MVEKLVERMEELFLRPLFTAQNLDVIKKRQAIMDTLGTNSIALFRMAKGDTPFDLAKVQASFATFQTEAAKLKTLFPEDSKTGGDTDASAKIWADKPAFDAVIDKFIALSKESSDASKDEASFKLAFPKASESCNNCHKESDGFAPRLRDSFKKMKPS